MSQLPYATVVTLTQKMMLPRSHNAPLSCRLTGRHVSGCCFTNTRRLGRSTPRSSIRTCHRKCRLGPCQKQKPWRKCELCSITSRTLSNFGLCVLKLAKTKEFQSEAKLPINIYIISNEVTIMSIFIHTISQYLLHFVIFELYNIMFKLYNVTLFLLSHLSSVLF